MLSKEVLDQYEMTIGMEIHVQLKTESKLFGTASNDARDAAPNTRVDELCFGLPGVLPVLNEKALELAIRAGIALNAEVAHFSKFDRKHYFYPDLPKGYQITQFDQPTVGKGYVDVMVDGETTRVGVTRAHIEEDAGKSVHPAGKDYSLVDLNRAGTPLLEIVSEPDIHSPEVAKAYAQEVYYLMKYADVSSVDLYQGNMRFDVNISVAKKGASRLGTRAEVKNLNSFRSVEKAAAYEFKRQIELLEKGEEVVQETRGWLDDKQKTVSQRSKEDAHDYRYFPEPDLPPIEIDQARIDAVRAAMPPLPGQIRDELSTLGLDSSQIETLLQYAAMTDVLRDIPKEQVKTVANWLSGPVIALADEQKTPADQLHLEAKALTELAQMVAEDALSSTGAKQVLAVMVSKGGQPKAIAEALNVMQTSDEGALGDIIDSVLAAHPEAAEDVKNGEMKAIGFLTGQVMKASKGQANPKKVQDILKQKLGG